MLYWCKRCNCLRTHGRPFYVPIELSEKFALNLYGDVYIDPTTPTVMKIKVDEACPVCRERMQKLL